MSAISRPTPRPTPAQRQLAAHRGDPSVAARRVATLVSLALLVGMTAGAFAGILLFVGGLAALAAYAATHPDHA